MAILCARIVLLGLIVLVGAYALAYSRHPTEVAMRFQLEEIHYQGLVHLDRRALDALIDQSVSKNLMSVDLDRIRDLVESESWVREATVRRKLPNQLVIHIRERQAIALAAIDNELYVVDEGGVILDRPGPSHQSIDRPIVRGLMNAARENAQEENILRMQVYLRVVEELASHNRSISEVDVETPEQVAVFPTEDPIPIHLGDDDFLRRYETFMSQKDLYDRLKEEYGTIESVDVTYDNKIIFHTPQKKGTTVMAQTSNPL
ncbi:MAG: FtsQ-type POTRA domain-containing protein [Acidobacteria bacterium]|nr:FtsQ-type POTRA domain-containing protein [Acidobacteriota bacterium]